MKIVKKISLFIIFLLLIFIFDNKVSAKEFERKEVKVDKIEAYSRPELISGFINLKNEIENANYFDTGKFVFKRKYTNGITDKILEINLFITNGKCNKYEAYFDNYLFYAFEINNNTYNLLKREEINFLKDYNFKFDGGYHTIIGKANNILGYFTSYSGTNYETTYVNPSSYDLEVLLYYQYYKETSYIDLYVDNINNISLDFILSNFNVYTDNNVICLAKSYITNLVKVNNGLYIIEIGAKRSQDYYATVIKIHIENNNKYEDKIFYLSSISSYTIAYNELNNYFTDYQYININYYLNNWNVEGNHYIDVIYGEDKLYYQRIKITVINDIDVEFNIKSNIIKTNNKSLIKEDVIIKSLSYNEDNVKDINIDFNDYINIDGNYNIYINLINKANVINKFDINIIVSDFNNNIPNIETSIYKLYDVRTYLNTLNIEIIYLNILDYSMNWNKEGNYIINLMYYKDDSLYYEDFYINVINPELEEIEFVQNPLLISYKDYDIEIINNNIIKGIDTNIKINTDSINNVGEYDIIITVYNDYLSKEYHLFLSIYDDITPQIIASNINTNINNKLSIEDIKKYIYIYDEIDGIIDDYILEDIDDYFNNYNKVGTYHFEINARDNSNNYISKGILINVNKKSDEDIIEIVLGNDHKFNKEDMINYLYKLSYINTLDVNIYSNYFDDLILKDEYELTVVDKYDNLKTFKIIINKIEKEEIIINKKDNNMIIIIVIIVISLIIIITIFGIIFYKKKH